jgi:hypothetical protein
LTSAAQSSVASRRALPDGIVLSSWRTVYVPVPKAACTSMLWTLADVQHESAETFDAAASAAVTRALLVHEPAFWRHTTLLRDLDAADLDRLRGDGDWLVFTMTRHPVDRLWSAWQSKLLMREPRFVDAFGASHWFPRVPRSPGDVVEDFRRFVDALMGDGALLTADRHWQPQVGLLQLDRLSYTHVGRTSCYRDTAAVVESHLRAQGWAGPLAQRRENATLIGVDALAAVDGDTRRRIEALYQDDMRVLGYADATGARRPAGPLDSTAAQQFVVSVREVIARHERLGDLLALLPRIEPAAP